MKIIACSGWQSIFPDCQ